MNSSFASQSLNDSLYMPTPQCALKANLGSVAMPHKLCFVDLVQVDQFVQQMNKIRSCNTPGCMGSLVPVSVRYSGLGGAVSMSYGCDGCASKWAVLGSSMGRQSSTEISMAIQVAFIVAGCTHATYCKVLQHALGMQAVSEATFRDTILKMHPIVEGMLDEWCEVAKNEMKAMDQSNLGSWKRAVTTADGTWQTRGYHSKNATFSIRNYFTGAMLYYKHLCQKGYDSEIRDDLYLGTSKSVEGFCARIPFNKAKEEGMDVEIHWQDADSSSSIGVQEAFPGAKVMICGGHAGKSHLKQLGVWASKKSFSKAMKTKHAKQFPQVMHAECHCKEKHAPGCGCLSQAFREKSRNYFSVILSSSETAEEFARRVRDLAKHACDVHEWDGGRYGFHALQVCSCGKCRDAGQLEYDGKQYHTRQKLSCPFHSLAYEIELNHRAEMAGDLVHPILKRGHSNLPEASHSVLIRYRHKHIQLERLHYHVSTNLGLLQSDLSYMHSKRGLEYNWIPELYRRMKLPVFEGVQQALEAYNKRRKAALDIRKDEKHKKRRLQLKIERTRDAQLRKAWSKRHGHDTYYDQDEIEAELDLPATSKQKQVSDKKCKACGSSTHMRSTHRECPFNKRKGTGVSDPNDAPVEQPLEGTCIPVEHDDCLSDDSLVSDEGACTSSYASSSDEECFEDDIIIVPVGLAAEDTRKPVQ